MALFLGGTFFACVGDIGGVLLTENANRLLSGDSGKAWVRVSQTINDVESDLSACTDHQILIFYNNATVADTLVRVSQAFDCDVAPALLDEKLIYEVDGNLDNHFEYSLSVATSQNAEALTISVFDITSQYLKIGFMEEENEVVEIYNFDAEVNDQWIVTE